MATRHLHRSKRTLLLAVQLYMLCACSQSAPFAGYHQDDHDHHSPQRHVSKALLSNKTDYQPHHQLHYHPTKDSGCYYILKHYRNQEKIETREPCLNCTCTNGMLMCYLQVCPFLKPEHKDCLLEKEEGQCCPKVWCPEASLPTTFPTFEHLPEGSEHSEAIATK